MIETLQPWAGYIFYAWVAIVIITILGSSRKEKRSQDQDENPGF